ncbi:MAG: TlpA family protein disulfide reductase [Phycisphaeraceae bacterium]|nr:MAG: TlpA family protein disulfide reductase [Phycisphaeraceae bacterium]
MPRMTRQSPINVLVAGVSLLIGAVAVAQDKPAPTEKPEAPKVVDTSGKPALLEAVEAAKQLKSMRAHVELSGAGGGMFQAYIPTGKGTLRLARQAEPVEDRAWNTRLDSSYVHKKDDPEQQVTILQTPTSFVWVDNDKKVVEERRYNEDRVQSRSILDLFGLPELTEPEPFSRELRFATSWKKLDQQKVNGMSCDVVEVRYDMLKAGDRGRGNSMTRTPASKWFFGVDDHLPRRVERITDEGMLSFTIVLDLTDVEVNPEIDPASLAVETPEGYTRTEAARQVDPEARAASVSKEQVAARRASKEKAFPKQLPAHGFELVDADGNPVSLESLKGNVAVLYFWGTWCMPCKEFSPLVSDLVDRFEGEPVKVFGLPYRERDEQAVRDAMKGYKHTLLLNPGGKPISCDTTARAYKVRVVPTIYVIGFDSEVLADKEHEAGVEAKDAVEQVAKTIQEYLDAHK